MFMSDSVPEDVKTSRSHCKVAFESWKNNDYSDEKTVLMKIIV